MAWTDLDWQAFAALMRRAWPGEFSDDDRRVYRLLLDDVEPPDAIAALRRLLHAGQRFRPSVAELLEAIRVDPSRPTFDEVLQLIYGSRGILAARPERSTFDDAGARQRAYNEAALRRAADIHPLVASFVQRHGIQRLRELPLHDPNYGEVRRRDLEAAWERHVEAFDGRDVAQLAAGGSHRPELRRLDPLAVLRTAAPAAELAPGAGEVAAGDSNDDQRSESAA
jgi:hypothetical protein